MVHRNRFVLFILSLMLFPALMHADIQESATITDIIKPLHLKAGQKDTVIVSDIFYAEEYPLSFLTHPEIEITYNEENRNLILHPAKESSGLTLIQFRYGAGEYSIPAIISYVQTQTFTYQPEEPVHKLTVFGSFNSWNRDNLPLTDPDGDGIYQTRVNLNPGRYEYKFFVNGREVNDPANPDSISNPFGSYNSVLTVSSPFTEDIYLHLMDYHEESAAHSITFYLERSQSQQILQKEDVIALFNNSPLPNDFIFLKDSFISIRLEKLPQYADGLLRVAVRRPGMPGYFQNLRFQDGIPCSSHSGNFEWQDAILYAVMVDRFLDGDTSNTRPVPNPEVDPKANFQGGDLQGILDKLNQGYFTDLGVNVLWLFPINQNTRHAYREYPPPHRYFTGYHGYWPVHHEAVDTRFGDMELFQRLVKRAHELGIRIILDFVANHVHEEHVFYRQHPEWFGTLILPDGRKNIRLWDEYRLTTWFDTFLPSFDYIGSREALEVMTDNAVWWMKTTGIDGFRQDAVKHVPNDFWRMLTRKLKKSIEEEEKRDIYQIGETFGSYDLISSYVNNGQLDAQFNFNLYDVALYVFLDPDGSFQTLNEEMKRTFNVYGTDHLMGNLMDSHDKVRYLAYADGDVLLSSPDAVEIGWEDPPQVDHPSSYRKARLYLTYMLTIPGVPVIYYGDEIGMTGAADPDNRRMMRFSEALIPPEREMLRSVSDLIQMRRKHSALRNGDFFPVLADKDIYAYIRSDIHERILVVLNKSAGTKSIRLGLPEIYDIQRARDLFSDSLITLDHNRIRINLDGISSGVYILESEK